MSELKVWMEPQWQHYQTTVDYASQMSRLNTTNDPAPPAIVEAMAGIFAAGYDAGVDMPPARQVELLRIQGGLIRSGIGDRGNLPRHVVVDALTASLIAHMRPLSEALDVTMNELISGLLSGLASAMKVQAETDPVAAVSMLAAVHNGLDTVLGVQVNDAGVVTMGVGHGRTN